MSAEDCERLLSWATDRGIELHGIEFRPIPGAGVGMVATKPLKPNERILYVPTSALRTLDTIRPKLKKALPPGTKVQALLAADLALDTPKSKYSPWNALLPSPQDLLTALPLAWFDPSLHRFLPPPALTLLQKQQAKFARDWSAVQPALTTLNRKTITRQGFLHAWLLANTRTFYHTSSSTARLPKDDRMILQPVADLFNHADSGCEVCFDAGSFTVSADRAYVPGEEVYICYGRHPNDFLMVEYGFVLERNRWDEVGLDEVVLEELGGEEKAVLEERGFLGKYVLDGEGVCYRTLVALRLLCLDSVEEWGRLVEEGEDGGEEVQSKVDKLLGRVLRKYMGRIDRMIQEIGGLEAGEPYQRKMLSTRWQQIRKLVDQAIERLGS